MDKNLIDELSKKESYNSIGNSDIPWRMVAERLLFSSDLLHKHGPIKDGVVIYPVVQMLRGMGVECLLKVAVRYSGKSIFKGGKVVLKSHNLLDISANVGIKFSKGERNILKDLTMSSSLTPPVIAPFGRYRLVAWLAFGEVSSHTD